MVVQCCQKDACPQLVSLSGESKGARACSTGFASAEPLLERAAWVAFIFFTRKKEKGCSDLRAKPSRGR